MTELPSSSEMLPVLASAESILCRFSAVPPELLASRALLQRVDRKYALPAHQVGSIAARLFGAYGVLRAGSALAARYRTVYYDTEDLCLYHAHRRGRAVRYKVRVRHHVDRQMSFVEVKHRNALGRSNKFVLPRPFGIAALDDEAQAFVEHHCPVPVRELSPRIWIEFRRITLVGCDVDERITFDCDLEYGYGHRSERWPHAAIAEVKQGQRSNRSPAIQALRGAGVIERSISKYSVATARLSDVRGNAFRPAAGSRADVEMREGMDVIGEVIRSNVAGLPGRLCVDLLFVFLVVRGVYTRLYRHRDYSFTYLLLNLVTFCISFVLSQVRVDLGFAMGLFAVFGILRYRTESIEVRDLTYLFVVIGQAVLNALVAPGVSLWQLLFVNVVIVGMVAVLESAPFSRREESRRVVYDRLELLAPGRASELVADLRTRTQLPVERYEIGNVDLFRDTANLVVFYERAQGDVAYDAARGPALVAGRTGQGTAA